MPSRHINITTGLELQNSITLPSTTPILHYGFLAPLELFSKGQQASAPIFLSDACQSSSDENACATLCADPKTMFATWQATWNCLTLAALWQASVTFTSDSDRSLISEIEAEISAFMPLNISAFDGQAVFNHTFECAVASCQKGNDGCRYSFEMAERFLNGNISEGQPFLDPSFCSGVYPQKNLDIQGPGIFVSLVLQQALCLYVWLASILFLSRTIVTVTASSALSIRSSLKRSPVTPKPTFSMHPRLSNFFARLEKANFFHATISFMAEFSEAQSFFVILITGAILYGKSQGAAFYGANSLEAVFQNQKESLFITLSSSVSIVAVQLSSYYVSMLSVYNLLLSTMAVLLGAVAATLQSKQSTIEEIRRLFAKDGTLDECGGNVSMRLLCGGSWGPASGYNHTYVYLWLMLVILAYLWYLTLFQKHAHRKVRSFLVAMAKTARINKLRGTGVSLFVWGFVRFCSRIPTTVLIIIQAALVPFLTWAIWPRLYWMLKDMELQNVERIAAWNIGQVVAVLVWIPVLSRYLYSLIFGVEDGFRARFSEAFTIIKSTGPEPNRRREWPMPRAPKNDAVGASRDLDDGSIMLSSFNTS